MEKRTLGAAGLEVGEIGLGVEHLQAVQRNMDEMFDLAVSAGVDYIDLVYNDPTEIYAEHWEALTPALQRHRDRLTLAAHWGFIAHEPVERCRTCFEQVLGRVGNDYVEHYGHGPGHESTNRERYAAMSAKGSNCTECGVCMERSINV
jgi:predicted aldo/keto reductase-like oxidoreductase